jgi:hypothetical protein
VELPADGNAQDNVCHFVYGGDAALPSLVVAEDRAIGRFLRHAAAAGGGGGAAREGLTPSGAEAANWEAIVAAQWQGGLPSAAAIGVVTQFVARGGALLCYAPARNCAGWFGLQWKDEEVAPQGTPFRVTTWDESDGLLAKTDNGENLPVATLEVLRRQRMTLTGADAADWHTVARFADGAPFLLQRRVERGHVYACATQPGEGWSTLGDGFVLVPLTQRVLTQGARHRSDTILVECGEWRPAPGAGPCLPLDGVAGRDAGLDAGVYRCGVQRVAVNRPAIEDDPERIESGVLATLLPSVKVRVYEDSAGRGESEAAQNEIWPLCLALALLCLLTESAILPRAAATRQPGGADGEGKS